MSGMRRRWPRAMKYTVLVGGGAVACLRQQRAVGARGQRRPQRDRLPDPRRSASAPVWPALMNASVALVGHGAPRAVAGRRPAGRSCRGRNVRHVPAAARRRARAWPPAPGAASGCEAIAAALCPQATALRPGGAVGACGADVGIEEAAHRASHRSSSGRSTCRLVRRAGFRLQAEARLGDVLFEHEIPAGIARLRGCRRRADPSRRSRRN